MTGHRMYSGRPFAAAGIALVLALGITGVVAGTAHADAVADVRARICAAVNVEQVAAIRAEGGVAVTLLEGLANPLPSLPVIRGFVGCTNVLPTTEPPAPTSSVPTSVVPTTGPSATEDPSPSATVTPVPTVPRVKDVQTG